MSVEAILLVIMTILFTISEAIAQIPDERVPQNSVIQFIHAAASTISKKMSG